MINKITEQNPRLSPHEAAAIIQSEGISIDPTDKRSLIDIAELIVERSIKKDIIIADSPGRIDE